MTYEDYMKLPMTKEDAKEILQMEIDWDWKKFRREATKDILARMLSNPEKISIRGERLATIEGFVNAAIEITDELIRKLKKK